MKSLTHISLNEKDSWEKLPVFPVWKQIFRGCLAEGGEDRKAEEGQEEEEGRNDAFDPAFFLLLADRKAGKDLLARAFAYDALRAGFTVYAGPARDVQEELNLLDEAGLEACISGIAAAGKVFLYIKRLDLLSQRRKKRRVFMDFLERLKALSLRLIVLSSATDEKMIDEELLDLFQVCPVSSPEKTEISLYFEKSLAGRIRLAEGLSWQALAAEAEGYSFGRLRELSINLRRFFDGGDPEGDQAGNEESGGRVPVLTQETFTRIRQLAAAAAGAVAAPSSEAAIYRAASHNQSDKAGGYKAAGAADVSVQPKAGHLLDKLEIDDEKMEEAGLELNQIKDDIGKGVEDYSDEELAKMGFEAEKELPEDEDALENLDEEGRAALFEMLDF